MNTLPIRPARLPQDAEKILEVFVAAKGIMVADGNTKQWVNGYPSLEVVQTDVERNGAFVVEDDGRIVAYFAFLPAPEPTYSTIYHGQWLDDTLPYHVIHRIASTPESHGILDALLDYCERQVDNIRIDTHEANIIMRKGLERHGYQYCGIIYLLDGNERMAFQKRL